MSKKLNGRSILKYTMQLGFATVISKGLGFVRELLMARYLGVGPLADAFFTAFRIPNSLRKIFAEGALSAAFVPTLTQVIAQEGREQGSRVTTAALLVMQAMLAVICAVFVFGAPFFIALQVPGWLVNDGQSSERFMVAVMLFKILIFYIMFISMSSLLAGTLQGINKFSVSAWGQIVMNIGWIIQLMVCSFYAVPLTTFCWFVLLNGAFYALFHCLFYWQEGFTFSFVFDKKVWASVWQGLKKFFPCALGLGAVEINLYIDQIVASYLPGGSLSLLNYTQGFVRLPLGVFAVAFGTILLPHFSRVSRYAPRRMGYYLLESSKLVLWVTLPATLLMSLFSYKIFYTTYYSFSDKFALEYVQQASVLLILSMLGLFFLSLNKIVVNIYYALHETRWPTIITIISTVCNTVFNIIGMRFLGLNGIVLATSLAAVIQLVLCVWVLHTRMRLPMYPRAFWDFCFNYFTQVALVSIVFSGLYGLCWYGISLCSAGITHLLFETMLYWLWVGPLCGLFMLALYVTRRQFGLRLHFLD
jgi:putative peptidoglycan lipid II flippase